MKKRVFFTTLATVVFYVMSATPATLPQSNSCYSLPDDAKNIRYEETLNTQPESAEDTLLQSAMRIELPAGARKLVSDGIWSPQPQQGTDSLSQLLQSADLPEIGEWMRFGQVLDVLSDSVGTIAPPSVIQTNTKPFLPTRGRIDRKINAVKFAYKGELALGLAASYGTISSDNTDFMLIVDGIGLEGSVFTINPSIGYFLSDNICLGVRFGYANTVGHLGNISLNLGSANDVTMSLSNVDFRNQMTTMAAFLRSYAGIDRKGHFGLFGELEFALKAGSSDFSYAPDGEKKLTKSNNTQFKLAFNSGVAVYIFPNVCCTLSFGLGGIQFNKITQKGADGNVVGSRQASKMLFRLNLADIRIGLNVHL